MMPSLHRSEQDRRTFLQAAAAITATAITTPCLARDESVSVESSPASQIRIGVMGVNGRGNALAKGFADQPNVVVQAICDVDQKVLDRVLADLEKHTGKAPVAHRDFRRMLDDRSLDAVVVAAPNHWHAPATILACNAGKHVYVEKPCSHTPQEGEWAVAAARKHDRVVQMGSQRRSWPAIQQAIAKIHAGEIGEVRYARTWYNNRRESIGTKLPSKPPATLDWDMWQGPAVRQPFQENVLHYHWHWFWHWGNGELGNNGIHAIDLARWGLQVQYPIRVTAGGGKYRYQDDQQTPDTLMATFDFAENKTITWEGLSWSALGPDQSQFGVSFHGTEGSVVLRDPGYSILDMKNKVISTHADRAGDTDHLANFLDSIRHSRRPHADIEEAHRSTLLCHLGNIAFRTQTTLQIDAANGHIKNLPDADAWWSKAYEKGWEPHV